MAKRSDKPTIPKDHPIRTVWADNEKSHVELARGGDRDAIKALLRQFEYSVFLSHREWEVGTYIVQPGHHYRIAPELIDYLLEVFGNIGRDSSPDKAFRWTHPGGKRGPRTTYKKRLRDARMAVRVADLIDELGEHNKSEAYARAGEEFGLQESAAEKAYRKHLIDVKEKLK